MKTRFAIILAALWLARAQGAEEFSLVSFTVDGGGGLQTGGEFSLVATIGQPDACPAIGGGAFTLEGGFWPFDWPPLLPVPEPVLHITPGPPGRITVSWPADFKDWLLQENTTLYPATWSNVGVGQPDGVWISLTFSISDPVKFFRLVQP